VASAVASRLVLARSVDHIGLSLFRVLLPIPDSHEVLFGPEE